MTIGILATALTLIASNPSRLPLINNGMELVQSELIAYNNENNEDEEYPLPHRRHHRATRPRTENLSTSSRSSKLPDILKNPTQLGVVLFALGLVFTLIGMILFFEGNLLKIGNIFLVSGAFLLFGPKKVTAFFMKESRLQAGIITSLGFVLLLAGKPKIGLLIEIFGLLNLFGNMFPLLLALGKNIPIVGDLFRSIERSFSNPDQYQPPPTASRKQYNPNYQPRREETNQNIPQF